MDLKRLEYFCAIVEKGQISKAARALHISQPPLSMRLKELEDEIGTELIFRKGKTWQITPAGEQLYKKAQFLLSYVAGLRNDILAEAGTLRGVVRFGVCPPCAALISSVMPHLRRRFPKLRFRIWVMDNQSLERHLQENHLAFALLVLPVQESNYTLTPLRRYNLLAVYGQGFSPPDKESVGIDDLASLPLAISHRREGAGTSSLLLKKFQSAGRQPDVVLETQDDRMLLSLLREGFPAVGIINEFEYAAWGSPYLAARRLDIGEVEIAPALVALRKTYISRASRAIMHHLAENYAPVSSEDADRLELPHNLSSDQQAAE